MLVYDAKDFSKSAFSLAFGMFVVVGAAAWHSKGDVFAVCLTMGLPLGVLAFWAIYSIKMKGMRDELQFYQQKLEEADEKQRTYIKNKLPSPHTALPKEMRQRLTIDPYETQMRTRLLRGRTAISPLSDREKIQTSDQWLKD